MMLDFQHAKTERCRSAKEVRTGVLCKAMRAEASLKHLDLSGHSGVDSDHDLAALQ